MNLGNASGPSLEAVAVSRRGDAVARRSEVRAQDEFAIKTARLKTAVRTGRLIKEIRSAMRGWMARVANRPNSRSKSSLNQVGCRARITLTDCRFRKSWSASDPAHEQHDGCGVEEGACGVDGGLEVLCQPSIAPNPGEEPFDDPAARVHGEADLIRVLAHDLDRDQRGLGDLLAGIPAVGEDALNEREDTPRDPQKQSATVAILDARRMRFEHEAAAVGVDHAWRLRPLIFFPAS